MLSTLLLAVWSCVGLVWWIVAWRLVCADQGRQHVADKGQGELSLQTEPSPGTHVWRHRPPDGERTSLSVFKPLPPLGAQGLRVIAPGLESFMEQLDAESELLLGIHEADRDFTGPFLKRLHTEHPGKRLRVIFRADPDGEANPKIAWERVLAPLAEGELWLWSDADIVAPAGFLQSARMEFARAGVKMMTFPYAVREIPALPTLLEALFVNVEFYPGVLLLREWGTVDFGLGAAILFRRDDFLREVDWDEIGAWLADDFFLGQKLGPVRIGNSTLATVPASQTLGKALLHDLRWVKTIRWNRPVGSFSRIVIMPVLGWLAAVALHPAHIFGWVGLVGMTQADVLFAALICRRTGCGLSLGKIAGMEFWSLWRIVLWFVCWLPWPVIWNGRSWWRAQVVEKVKSS